MNAPGGTNEEVGGTTSNRITIDEDNATKDTTNIMAININNINNSN